VILTSSHEKIFSAGGNLAGFASDQPLINKFDSTSQFPKLFQLLGELGKPSICAANGHVLAGSLGLALACDFILAKEGVRFGAPEINVGVFPFVVTALLYRNIPRKHATELLLMGEQISAERAEQIGLINRVFAAEEFGSSVAEWAEKLAKKSPLLMRLGKDSIYRQQDMGFTDALNYLHSQLTIAFATEDLHEGIAAFFEKRDPVWKGK
jgi:enoyl-CoA hydratase/carnithine racemase